MMLLPLLACAHGGAATTTLRVGTTELAVEIADTPEERAQGLMYRDHLADDRGMLFVYPDAQERRFWMKNTRIPLSIAFLDPAGTILSIADMKPLDTNTTPSGAPAMYALEVNKGWFAAHGVTVGTLVTGLPPAAAK